MKYNQKLPEDVEAQLDAYIERIKNIKWFQPSQNLKRSEIDTQVNVVLEAFGVKASVEYRSLKTPQDWDAAWGAARGAARGAAWGAAWDAAWDVALDAAWDAARGAVWGVARRAALDAARDAAWDVALDAAREAALDAARDAAWGAAWGAARDAALGAVDILALNLEEYKAKYPTGNFIHLIPLWEAGLYPVGVINEAFVVYVPPSKTEFPNDLI